MKKANPYRKIDTERTDQAYWEKVLSDTGSGMSRGSLRGDPKQKQAIIILLSGSKKDIEGFFGNQHRVLEVQELVEIEQLGLDVVDTKD